MSKVIMPDKNDELLLFQLPREDRAYFAGLFDGEGTININTQEDWDLAEEKYALKLEEPPPLKKPRSSRKPRRL